MDYTTFLETVRQTLMSEVGEGYQVTVKPIPKNNGITLDGLSIRPREEPLAPTIYLNPYYEQYRQGMTLQEITSDILELFRNNPPPEAISEDRLSDFGRMRSRVMLRLIHADSNQELLKDVPHIPYLDLAIVFYLFLGRNASGQMTALIHNEYRERWKTDEKKLLRLALRNTPAVYPAEIKSITDVMKDIAFQNLGEDYDEEHMERLLGEEENISPLYVLSNQAGIYGAGCILYKNVLKDFADTLGKDLIIIPSSIHEVLLTPDEHGDGYSQLNSMVVNINRYEVPPEDQLSDHVYLYTRARDRITIARG